MTNEELKDKLRATIKRPEPKPVAPPLTSADEVAIAINGGVVVGRPDRVGFDIVTNSVVTMQWKRCEPAAMGWDVLRRTRHRNDRIERKPDCDCADRQGWSAHGRLPS
jgi:hypothetical protein